MCLSPNIICSGFWSTLHATRAPNCYLELQFVVLVVYFCLVGCWLVVWSVVVLVVVLVVVVCLIKQHFAKKCDFI